MKPAFFFFFLLFSGWVTAQTKVPAVVLGADTMPAAYLPNVEITEKLSSEAVKNMQKFNKLVRDVKRALPYAKLAAAKLKEINDHCATLQTEKERKKYIDETEKLLRKEFEEPLKRLTITQGKILIKLIDRETGNTSYELVKELRGSFQAFMWQSLARLFGENLKEKYDPENEDWMIETVVKGIENGTL